MTHHYFSYYEKMLWRVVCALFVLMALTALASAFAGCTPHRVASDTREHRLTTEWMSRIDSLLHVRTVAVHDSAWRQEILRQFESIREKTDTNWSVTLNALGDTIREKIVINNVRETTSATDRHEREVLMRRVEVMDSVMRLMQLQMSHSDSLLQQDRRTEIREVAKPLSWWQQARLWLGNILLVALALLLAIWLLKKKLPWLP